MEAKFNERNAKDYHSVLSEYFSKERPLYLDGEEFKKPHVRKLVEQPWQELKAAVMHEAEVEKIQNTIYNIQDEIVKTEKLWDNITNTLCNLDFIQAKAAAKLTYDLVNEINNALEGIPENVAEIAREKARQARMDKYTHDLIACANEEISIDELEIPDCITPWTEEQINAEIERIKTNPNRADRLRDFKIFLGHNAEYLNYYANEHHHFTQQQAWNYSKSGFVGKLPLESIEKINKGLLHPNKYRPQREPLPIINKKLIAHKEGVNCIVITPDCQKAFSGSNDKTCILWNLDLGNVIRILGGHTDYVYDVDITPDGKLGISGSADNRCILWNLNSGSLIRILTGHNGTVTKVNISLNGKTAISRSSNNEYIEWDLENGCILRKSENDFFSDINEYSEKKPSKSRNINVYSYFPNLYLITKRNNSNKSESKIYDTTVDNKMVICSSETGKCVLKDSISGKVYKILAGHKRAILDAAISADGRIAVTASLDENCIVWDLEKGQSRDERRIGHTDSVNDVAKAPYINKAITASWDQKCLLWDLEKIIPEKSLIGHWSPIFSVDICPNGDKAISGSLDGYCLIWDLEKGIFERNNLKIRHADAVSSIKVLPGGRYAISASWDKSFILWDLANGNNLRQLNKLHKASINSVSIFPDSKMCCSVSDNNECILWNINTGQILKEIEVYDDLIDFIKIAPDGKTILVPTRNDQCSQYDIRNGELINSFSGHKKKIKDIVFTSNAKFAISGSKDKTCILWDLFNSIAVSRFIGSSEISALELMRDNLYAYDKSGEINSLKIPKEFLINRGIVTLTTIWDFKQKKYTEITAYCPFCLARLSPDKFVLFTIKSIINESSLTLFQSPILSLPDEAWEHPGLLSECPKCKEELKFNPFIAGGEEY